MIDSGLSSRFRFTSAIAMLAVVFIHSKLIMSRWSDCFDWDSTIGKISWYVQFIISENIARIAVPVFFFVSGYFIAQKLDGSVSKYKDVIKTRVKTILIPYILFCILWAIPYVLSGMTLNPIGILIRPIPYQFWFLQHLMLLTILSIIFVYINNRIPTLGLILVTSSIIIYVIFASRWGDWKESMCFYVLGLYFSNLKRVKIKNWILPFLVLLYIALLTYICSACLNNLIIHHIEVLLGFIVIFLWIFSSNFSAPILITSGCSFLIFALHEPIMGIFKSSLIRIGMGNYGGFTIYFMIPIFTILLICIVYQFMCKYAKPVISIFTGGR